MTVEKLSPEAKAWRNAQRARLVALRLSYSEDARRDWTARIMQRLEPVAMTAEGPISVYWPFRGEPDLRPLMRRLAMEPDLVVGDNEPYSGRDGHGYSMKAHAERKGLAHALFEIRQDLIAEDSGQARWADILHRVLTDVLDDPGLHQIKMGEGAA